ncbi:MAG: glycosyltransferase family 2 protein [Chloroflexota bacterium]
MAPFVSIIVPCFNEQATILGLLSALDGQTYQRSAMEVIIADGMSTDNTRSLVASFSAQHPDLVIVLIDNPDRIIPAALNRAIETARGEIIVRLDAHSWPYPDYVEKCVASLQAGLGENVGGVWEIQAINEHWIARSIAEAAGHPLGVGDALYRYATKSSYVDTVPFGAFKRDLLAQIGFFDETLLTNEDYEFNTRIRKSGGRIWLDPAIRSVYYTRASLGSLAKQYWRYGYWKWQMLKRYPETLRWRQGLPPVFVLSLLLGAILAFFLSSFRYFIVVEIIAYFSILGVASLERSWRRRQPSLLAGMPLAIAIMHISWGAGFLWSIIKNMTIYKAQRGHG